MAASRNSFASRFETTRIDRESGVIFGVAVITEGPALGHGMSVDAVTLAQVKEAAETYSNGLKVKMTHGGDAGDIVGALRGFRIDGKTLRADFYLLRSYEKRDYVLELAETIPDTFGMSISFSGPDEKLDGKIFARCVEIYSCDIVAEPAANPSGLFSEANTPKQNHPTMTPEEIKAAVDSAMSAALEPMLARLSKLETAAAPKEEKPEDEAAMSAKLTKVAELAAISVIKQFNLAAPEPAKASAASAAKLDRKFEEIVREFKVAGKNHNDALREAMDKHPEAHKDYSARLAKGEVIMF